MRPCPLKTTLPVNSCVCATESENVFYDELNIPRARHSEAGDNDGMFCIGCVLVALLAGTHATGSTVAGPVSSSEMQD